MNELTGEQIRFIKQEVAKQVNILLGGKAGASTPTTESIDEVYPGMPTMVDRPIVHPFGVASRAPQGTPVLSGRTGEHPTSRVVLGHRDPDRPACDEGETIIYNLAKYQVRLLKDKIQIGKAGTWETVVVGETLRELLKSMIQLYAAHKHVGNLGYFTAVPDNATQYTQLKTDNLDNDKILAKDGGRF